MHLAFGPRSRNTFRPAHAHEDSYTVIESNYIRVFTGSSLIEESFACNFVSVVSFLKEKKLKYCYKQTNEQNNKSTKSGLLDVTIKKKKKHLKS